MNTQKLHNVIL